MTKKVSDKVVFHEKADIAIKTLADIVKVTLGPDGLPVVLQREKASPHITKDGVTVSESVFVEDIEADTIIQAVKESAKTTVENAGDGTTTSIVLTEAIYTEAMKHVRSGSITPQRIFNQIAKAASVVEKEIESLSLPVETNEQRKNVALISSNGDESIANAIVEAIDNVGEDGYIGLEQGSAKETTLRFVDGLHLDRGFQHWGSVGHGFCNITENNEVMYDNVFVALYNGTISSYADLMPLMTLIHETRQKALADKQPDIALFIVAQNIVGEALGFLLANRQQSQFPIYAIKAPITGSPNSAALLLDDLAVLTGGQTMSPEGIKLTEVSLESLGAVRKIVGKARQTVLYEPEGDLGEIEKRVASLKKEVEDADNDFDKDNLKKRIGQLVNGICLIGVGGTTDFETKEKKDRVDDALCSVRAASEEGIVAGAGMTLYYTVEKLWGNKEDLNFGEKVLHQALKYPSQQILKNGNKSHDRILTEVVTKGYPYGYDAREEQSCDLIENGIIDPTKVVRMALQSSVSIASELIRCGGIVTFSKRKEEIELPMM